MANYNLLFLQLLRIWLNHLRIISEIERRSVIRRWWSKPHIRNNMRSGYGAFRTVYHYFKMNDEEEFLNFTRLTIHQFNAAFNLVEQALQKRSRRTPLPPELRFVLVLNYLGHGDSIMKNAWFFSIGSSTIYNIVPEVCEVICRILAPIYLIFPDIRGFEDIAEEFNEKLHFPNCFGAIDGRHCRLKQPPRSAALFFNYKKFYSMVLMAICDAYMRFTWVNIGDFGSLNDAGVFANSDLGIALENQQIPLPAPTRLHNSELVSPFFLIGDGGFPLKRFLMKPYLRTERMTVPQRVFNYRLSSARRIIENAYGVLAQRWRVNETALAWKLSTSEFIILSSICLHNMIITMELHDAGNYRANRRYTMKADVRNDPVNLHEEQPLPNNFPEMQSIFIRERLSQYFVSPAGMVHWQYNQI